MAEKKKTLGAAGESVAFIQLPGLDGESLEKLAEAAHEVFCDDLRLRGYRYGRATSEAKKTHASLKPYAELPENEKEQNRNSVRDIPNKLAHIGRILLPSRGDVTAEDFSDEEIEHLAEMEHERWMRQKLQEGWRYAEVTDKAGRLHQALLPWEKLPESERDKDRAMVRGIPVILGKAGYRAVRSDRSKPGLPRKMRE